MDLLGLINDNQGLLLLGILVSVIESRVHLRHVFRRLDKLEE